MAFSPDGIITTPRKGVKNSSMVVVMGTPTDSKLMPSVKRDAAQVSFYDYNNTHPH